MISGRSDDMSLTAVSGYYDGTGIVMDEEVTMSVGQRVIITILEKKPEHQPEQRIRLDKYMGRGKKMFTEDAGEYVKGLRQNDRV